MAVVVTVKDPVATTLLSVAVNERAFTVVVFLMVKVPEYCAELLVGFELSTVYRIVAPAAADCMVTRTESKKVPLSGFITGIVGVR
jgi:hypothetical protein